MCSTGLFGFNRYIAAFYALVTVRWFLQWHEGIVVTFCCNKKEDYDVYHSLHELVFPEEKAPPTA